MTPFFRSACTAFALTGMAMAAEAASNLAEPTYPLGANEKLYADLAKLPAAERHAKIMEGSKKESGDFNLLHAIQGQLGTGHVAIFKKNYPHAKVSLSQLGSNEPMECMIIEERAGKHITDIISSTELTEMTQALEAGLQARYPSPADQKILPQYRGFFDPHNRWLITHWSEQGMSFNTKLIKPADEPKGWFDLCDPKHKGQHSYEPIRTRFNVFLRDMLGEEKVIDLMKCIGQNEPILMKGQSNRTQLMIAGDHAIQGINFFFSCARRGARARYPSRRSTRRRSWRAAPVA